MTYFLARFTSLFSYRVFERRVLLDLAALRAGGSALIGATAFVAVEGWPVWAALLFVASCGVVWALVCADWIEHYGRLLIFGYSYNPNVSARCELEGGTMPTNREAEPEWRRTLYTRLMVGDDPGPGHYPYPIPTFTGRLRAIMTGE